VGIKVLIADDHPVVRVGIGGMLAGEPDIEVAGEAQNGEEAAQLADRLRPDVVLMDLRMPETDGVAATSRITERCPDTRVLILTTYETDADIMRAIEAGATGYLLKDAPRGELLRAIRTAASGESSLSPAVASRLIRRARSPADETLSARELEVIGLVARGKGNKEIAKELWISETTVKSHLMRAFEKLGVNDRTAAATEALKLGIIRLDS
jgi:DNA-binding NarL/FixJ family response regulator